MKIKLLRISLSLLTAITIFSDCSKKVEKDENDEKYETGNQVRNNPCSTFHPLGVYNIYPHDSSAVQPAGLTLKWSGDGVLPLKFDVLFGTNPDSVKLIASNLTDSYLPLEPLRRGTTYYWNIKIKDRCGWTRSSLLSFKIIPDSTIPYLTTSSVPFICSTTAPAGGNVYYEGLTPVTERGIYYGISADPEKSGTKLQLGSGFGSFSTILSQLNENTKYYIKAYATNDNGTFFGPEITFTTGLNNPFQYVSDIEGNKYKYLTIGTQTWMAENLKTSKYNDGSIILLLINGNEWASIAAPAFCWYSNDSARYKNLYGGIYNWYAVNTGKLCPSSWHVPSDSEWKTLEMFLGMTAAQADGFYWRGADLGTQLKDSTGWGTQGLEGNGLNYSGFSALPGGQRDQWTGTFLDARFTGGWWSATNSTEFSYAYPMTGPYARLLDAGANGVSRTRNNPAIGFSVRCIKD